MEITGLIVAAGRGTRAGSGLPKQYRPLCGEPVLRHTIRALLADRAVKAVQVVIHADDRELYSQTVAPLADPRLQAPVMGGDSRSSSVSNGLAACSGDVVLIHDGARPLLPVDALARLIAQMAQSDAAFLAVPVNDALWRVEGGLAVSEQPRDGLWRGQTPQAFRLDVIRAAHAECHAPMADDVAVARAAGIEVVAVVGTEKNLKITRPEDFALAEKLMEQNMDIRTGNGFDVHKFGPGDHVTLNGVVIPHDQGLVGHSDADVGMHAITDAIFGALAEGDIGQWFPPSEMEWKGAASDIFLLKAMERSRARGFTVTHLDCTLVCEHPKIGPHAARMRERLAAITGLELDRVSVKATTSEKLGFTGRGEGIAALATATLVKS
ncbi:MAG: bifunctional 2-C-methyl-D-erythritol 4-phosphate cytidylyltransferase/2-C-methyl-D-erythritol 2,4-cyclodiphosphate synthase [Rhodobacteraceae bacterium]|nr:bifunctional 2-C-methyl-D-erythritol 4-phosphate cytidylyltransferase/2-C-methyl-D-erythritol 2,4-cyclodiphosphate synthase [Paracoccaceae bacterium]